MKTFLIVLFFIAVIILFGLLLYSEYNYDKERKLFFSEIPPNDIDKKELTKETIIKDQNVYNNLLWTMLFLYLGWGLLTILVTTYGLNVNYFRLLLICYFIIAIFIVKKHIDEIVLINREKYSIEEGRFLRLHEDFIVIDSQTIPVTITNRVDKKKINNSDLLYMVSLNNGKKYYFFQKDFYKKEKK